MTVLLTNPGQKRVNLIDNAIWIKPPDNLNKINLKIRIKVVPKTKLNNVSNIGFLSQNSLNLSQLLIKKIFSDSIQLNTLVQDNQYVIRHTILAKVLTTFKQKFNIQSIKKHKNKLNRMMLFGSQNYSIYPNKDNFLYYKIGDFIKVGDKLSPQIKVQYSGKIIQITEKVITIHKATPIFLTGNTEFYKRQKSFVKEKELLGTISFKQIVTGDIIQGLPKIEEILEARKKKIPALLASQPGLIKAIDYKEIKVTGNWGRVGA
jgi:DNA-directed RNA polymerase subunit beta'